MEDFRELAQGAHELEVRVERGDISVRVDEGVGWSLDWSSDGDQEPEIERDGAVLRLRQRPRSGGSGSGGGTYAANVVSGEGTFGGSIGGIVDGVVGEALRGIEGLIHRRLDVRLTLPPGVEVVELHSGYGRIDAEGMRSRTRLKSGFGVLTLRASAGEAELTTGKGSVEIDGHDGDTRASTGYGDVRAARLRGKAHLKSGNGAVEVLDCDGEVKASSGNGDISLRGVAGEAEVTTGRGQVTIRAPRQLAVRATTGMGAIHVDDGSVRGLRLHSGMGALSVSAGLAPGTYELTTGMGAIEMALHPGVATRVDAQSSFGQVRSDFPLVRVGRSGPLGFGAVRMVGSIGEGEPRVDVALRTGKGEVTLRRAGAYAAPGAGRPYQAEPERAPDEPVVTDAMRSDPPPSSSGRSTGRPDSTRAVLEALARGDITPTEAEDLLTQVS